jgi:palmitoyl transferase
MSPMPRRTHARAVLLLALFAPIAASAEEPTRSWDRILSAINSTTTFALASKEEQDKGWFSGVWDGMKRVWSEGSSDLYLSGYYWHTPWGFSDEKRAEYNDWGLGGGYGRSLSDEKGNQRMLYAIVVQDSFRKPMYLAGYGWLARWNVAQDLRLGAGYSLAIISNSAATNYIPFPAPVPLLSIGTENTSLYGTYINSIAYLFLKVSF